MANKTKAANNINERDNQALWGKLATHINEIGVDHFRFGIYCYKKKCIDFSVN